MGTNKESDELPEALESIVWIMEDKSGAGLSSRVTAPVTAINEFAEFVVPASSVSGGSFTVELLGKTKRNSIKIPTDMELTALEGESPLGPCLTEAIKPIGTCFSGADIDISSLEKPKSATRTTPKQDQKIEEIAPVTSAQILPLVSNSLFLMGFDGNSLTNSSNAGATLPVSTGEFVEGSFGDAVQFSGNDSQDVTISEADGNSNFNFSLDESFAVFSWFRRPKDNPCGREINDTNGINEVIVSHVRLLNGNSSSWWFGCLKEDNQMVARFLLWNERNVLGPRFEARSGVGYQLDDGQWHLS